MRQINRTSLAEADLRETLEYLCEHSEPAAEAFANDLSSALRIVAGQPRMGRDRSDVSNGARSIVLGRYVVFYRFDDDEIMVLRIIHGSRDIPRVFGVPE